MTKGLHIILSVTEISKLIQNFEWHINLWEHRTLHQDDLDLEDENIYEGYVLTFVEMLNLIAT